MGFLVKLFGGVEKSEVEQMKASHQAELDKMKKLYAEQIDEIQTAFRAKTASLKKDLEEYKENNNTEELSAAHEAELDKMKNCMRNRSMRSRRRSETEIIPYRQSYPDIRKRAQLLRKK